MSFFEEQMKKLEAGLVTEEDSLISPIWKWRKSLLSEPYQSTSRVNDHEVTPVPNLIYDRYPPTLIESELNILLVIIHQTYA